MSLKIIHFFREKGLEPVRQMRNVGQNKKAPMFGSLLIWNKAMVRERGQGWNRLRSEILIISEKLEKQGFVYEDGNVFIVEEEF